MPLVPFSALRSMACRSILPPFYIGYFAYRTGFTDTRLTTMFVLSLVWGLRLSYNFYRKGTPFVTHI